MATGAPPHSHRIPTDLAVEERVCEPDLHRRDARLAILHQSPLGAQLLRRLRPVATVGPEESGVGGHDGLREQRPGGVRCGSMRGVARWEGRCARV